MYPLMNPDPEMASPYPTEFQYMSNGYLPETLTPYNDLSPTSSVRSLNSMESGDYCLSESLISSSPSPSQTSSLTPHHLQNPQNSSHQRHQQQIDQITSLESASFKREKPSSTSQQLILVKQPAINHRARYKTEGSRGAVKDRSGKGFPVIRLEGYNQKQPVKLVCFIGDENKLGEPHPIYKVSKVTSRTATPCLTRSVNGVKALEFELLPDKNMQLEINCIGILKERMFEVKKKLNLIFAKSHSCRLVFACLIPETGVLCKIISEPIVCVQTLGCPEIHLTSTRKAPMSGGKEVIIIGRNFTRDAVVQLDLIGRSGSGSSSRMEILPLQEYLNSGHLVFRSPSLTQLANYHKVDDLETELRVICGDKVSESVKFHFHRRNLLESALLRHH